MPSRLRRGICRHDDEAVTALADAVLPLIRTRAEVWQWNTANAHGDRMLEAVAILRQAAEDDDPVDVFAVTQRAIASALKVIIGPMTPAESSGAPVTTFSSFTRSQRPGPARHRPNSSTGW